MGGDNVAIKSIQASTHVDGFDGDDFGDGAFHSVFDTGFEGHHAHRAVFAGTQQFETNNIVFGYFYDADISAIGFEKRAELFQGFFDAGDFFCSRHERDKGKEKVGLRAGPFKKGNQKQEAGGQTTTGIRLLASGLWRLVSGF